MQFSNANQPIQSPHIQPPPLSGHTWGHYSTLITPVSGARQLGTACMSQNPLNLLLLTPLYLSTEITMKTVTHISLPLPPRLLMDSDITPVLSSPYHAKPPVSSCLFWLNLPPYLEKHPFWLLSSVPLFVFFICVNCICSILTTTPTPFPTETLISLSHMCFFFHTCLKEMEIKHEHGSKILWYILYFFW